MTLTWALVAIFLLHPLPFVSMQGHDEWREFDCGPTAAAAIIEAYTGEATHAYEYYEEFGVADNPQRPGYVAQWLIRRGVPTTFAADAGALETEKLIALLTDRPVIVGMPGHWETAIGYADGYFILFDPWEKTQTARFVSDAEMAATWHGVAIWPQEALWETP